ncbi:MAG: hypothetical protein JWP75_282 [Frondihabitans sp.]|nr:hypothetical protein [Frondihabitans sp.]
MVRTAAEWPPGTGIVFDDYDYELYPLLFSRSTWQLDVAVSLPSSLSVEPEVSRSPPPHTDELAELWGVAWRRRMAHLSDFDDFDVEQEGLEAYFAAWRTMQASLPPPWQDSTAEWFDDAAFATWSTAVSSAADTSVRPGIESAVINACEDGLRHVTLLPFDDQYAKRVSRRRLVVSGQTWNDDDALTRFLSRRPPAA